MFSTQAEKRQQNYSFKVVDDKLQATSNFS